MKITVALPAAWCLAPLQEIAWISDPDLDDYPPRYGSPLKDGWTAVHEAVMSVYRAMQDAQLDVLRTSWDVEVSTTLTRSQESIVYGWFFQGEAPQWSPEEEAWLNGRHRTWALKDAGFVSAPCLLIPVGDAIQFWDDHDWGPLDEQAVEYQRANLGWWMADPIAEAWRSANPIFAARWTEIIERWDRRLAESTDPLVL